MAAPAAGSGAAPERTRTEPAQRHAPSASASAKSRNARSIAGLSDRCSAPVPNMSTSRPTAARGDRFRHARSVQVANGARIEVPCVTDLALDQLHVARSHGARRPLGPDELAGALAQCQAVGHVRNQFADGVLETIRMAELHRRKRRRRIDAVDGQILVARIASDHGRLSEICRFRREPSHAGVGVQLIDDKVAARQLVQDDIVRHVDELDEIDGVALFAKAVRSPA